MPRHATPRPAPPRRAPRVVAERTLDLTLGGVVLMAAAGTLSFFAMAWVGEHRRQLFFKVNSPYL